MPIYKNNLQRDTLYKLSQRDSNPLIPLRIEYSLYSHLLTNYINKLINVNRVYPHHLPTQASFRWSTVDPPITNWPRACINQTCSQQEHEWGDKCWSVRDILQCDDDEILITWDHDNIEGRIHDLIVNDEQAITSHKEGYDLHTLTCCDIFGYNYPSNRKNPHTSTEDVEWRSAYNWQGKDTKQRVLAKNFNHGSKYTKTWRFIYRIPGIEKYSISRDHLGKLAKRYIESKGKAWTRKLKVMEGIRRSRISRTLYGGRRVFFDSSEETAREGFSHMISGTVSDYNNETLRLIEEWLGDDVRLLHNAHDVDKIAVKQSAIIEWGNVNDSMKTFKTQLQSIIERPIEYQGRSLIMTAGVKIHE